VNKFICLGAHNGGAVKTLDKMNTEEVLGIKELVWHEIHLFEPQPHHSENLQTLQQEDSRVVYHPNAAYIEDTELDFFIRGAGSTGFVGSTADKGKHTQRHVRTVTVQGINFLKWLEDNTTPDDFTYLDMDIECGEYLLLPRIIESEIGSRINFLSVEWHPDKSKTWKGLQEGIEKQAKTYFGNRLLDHTEIFGWL
jgi:FkbM family methyltransferase